MSSKFSEDLISLIGMKRFRSAAKPSTSTKVSKKATSKIPEATEDIKEGLKELISNTNKLKECGKSILD